MDRLLAKRLNAQAAVINYRDDPALWTRHRTGEHLWSKQAEVMQSVDRHERTAVPSCNAAGKTHLASLAATRFIDIHPPGTAFVFTTAPRQQTVKTVMWRYIRRHHHKAGLPGYITQSEVPEWKIGGDTVGFGRSPAVNDADSIMGLHEKHLLVIVDEADGVTDGVWSAIESLLTNEGCHVLAIGNPLDNSSHFARMCDGSDPGWNIIRISAFDTPAMTGEWMPPGVPIVTRHWIEDKATRWGVNSPMYKAKVLALHPDAADGLIPMSWVKAAHERWWAWFDSYQGQGAGDYDAARAALWRGDPQEPHGRRVISCDVATTGDDDTAIATKQGDVVMGVERWSGLEIPTINRLIADRLTHPQARAVVDAVGEGAGVYQTMRRHYPISAFKGSYATKVRDSSGVLRFPDWRVAAWYHLRELLNPQLGATLALPPDDELTADLTTPKVENRTGGQVWVESKDEVRKRLGRSIDAGDAVAMACWHDKVGAPETPPDGGQGRRGPRVHSYPGQQF
jgi:hypothetical protein